MLIYKTFLGKGKTIQGKGVVYHSTFDHQLHPRDAASVYAEFTQIYAKKITQKLPACVCHPTLLMPAGPAGLKRQQDPQSLGGPCLVIKVAFAEI